MMLIGLLDEQEVFKAEEKSLSVCVLFGMRGEGGTVAKEEEEEVEDFSCSFTISSHFDTLSSIMKYKHS